MAASRGRPERVASERFPERLRGLLQIALPFELDTLPHEFEHARKTLGPLETRFSRCMVRIDSEDQLELLSGQLGLAGIQCRVTGTERGRYDLRRPAE